MKLHHTVVACIILAFASTAFAQSYQASARSTDRITKEVRHELLMLPYLGVFDNLAYKVDGNNVTLIGQVTRPTLKSDAENVVKKIEGVERVDNLYRAIYGFPALQKYAMGVQQPIRIIVKGGRVTLEGVVDNEADKNITNIQANGVPGVFSVTNNLQVVKN